LKHTVSDKRGPSRTDRNGPTATLTYSLIVSGISICIGDNNNTNSSHNDVTKKTTLLYKPYHSKNQNRIFDVLLVFHYVCLLSFPRYDYLSVENLRFFAILPIPDSFEAFAKYNTIQYNINLFSRRQLCHSKKE